MDKLIEKIWYEEFRPSEKHFIYNEEIKRKQLFLDNYEEKLRKWCQFDSDVGWGKFDISIDVNEETGDFRGELTISECFIVDIKDKRPICEFVKGYCDGVIETLLGVKVELICRTCPLKNRFKNACVFDILIKED